MKNRLLIIDDLPDICEIVSGSRMMERLSQGAQSERKEAAMICGIIMSAVVIIVMLSSLMDCIYLELTHDDRNMPDF